VPARSQVTLLTSLTPFYRSPFRHYAIASANPVGRAPVSVLQRSVKTGHPFKFDATLSAVNIIFPMSPTAALQSESRNLIVLNNSSTRSGCSLKNNQSLQPNSLRDIYLTKFLFERISFHQSPGETLSTRTSFLFQSHLFLKSN
jgi:hypothetical protein